MTLTTMPPLIANQEADLDGDMVERIVDFLFGNGKFDLDGKFMADGVSHELAEIHVKVSPDQTLPQNEAKLATETGQDLFVYLKNVSGTSFPFNVCESLTTDLHTMGILFKGADGGAWFADTSFGGHDVLQGDNPAKFSVDEVPLHKIHGQSALCARQNGAVEEMIADCAMDGEFVITEEINARLVSIPWMSGFGISCERSFQSEQATVDRLYAELDVLDKLKARTELMAGPSPTAELCWVAGSAQEVANGEFSQGPTADIDVIIRMARQGDIIAGKGPSDDVLSTWYKMKDDLVRLPDGINGATHETLLRLTQGEPQLRMSTRADVAIRLLGDIDDWTDPAAAQDMKNDVLRFLKGIGGAVLEGRLANEAFTFVRTGQSHNGFMQVLVDIRPAEPALVLDIDAGQDMEP